jgi:hypothetical protein
VSARSSGRVALERPRPEHHPDRDQPDPDEQPDADGESVIVS